VTSKAVHNQGINLGFIDGEPTSLAAELSWYPSLDPLSPGMEEGGSKVMLCALGIAAQFTDSPLLFPREEDEELIVERMERSDWLAILLDSPHSRKDLF